MNLGFHLLQKFLRAFFRTFYLLEVRGLEHFPATGPVVLAANHVNPFDAIILGAVVPRPIRFVVWNKTFNKPSLNWIMRRCGCIPINRDRPDSNAFKESMRWLATGNILGIFPEGRYTETGHLHELKPGTMRIGLAGNAAVVPATITGAYRAWPLRGANAKAFPRPWRIQVKLHPPIQPPTDAGNHRAAAEQLTTELAAAINSTLKPAVRAEEKLDKLLTQPAPHIRIYEWFLIAVLLFTRQSLAAWVAGGYAAYLLIDIYIVKQSAPTRALRSFSPAIALAGAYPVLQSLAGPAPQGWLRNATLIALAYIAWTMARQCFLSHRQFRSLLRGFLLTLYAGIVCLLLTNPMPRPGLILLLTLFTLTHQNQWIPALIVIGGVLAVGFPPGWLAVNVLILITVSAYLRLFPVRA